MTETQQHKSESQIDPLRREELRRKLTDFTVNRREQIITTESKPTESKPLDGINIPITIETNFTDEFRICIDLSDILNNNTE